MKNESGDKEMRNRLSQFLQRKDGTGAGVAKGPSSVAKGPVKPVSGRVSTSGGAPVRPAVAKRDSPRPTSKISVVKRESVPLHTPVTQKRPAPVTPIVAAAKRICLDDSRSLNDQRRTLLYAQLEGNVNFKPQPAQKHEHLLEMSERDIAKRRSLEDQLARELDEAVSELESRSVVLQRYYAQVVANGQPIVDEGEFSSIMVGFADIRAGVKGCLETANHFAELADLKRDLADLLDGFASKYDLVDANCNRLLLNTIV